MQIQILSSKDAMGQLAAQTGAAYIRQAISARGEARVIVATGASQFEMLSHLVKAPDINWSVVTFFHLDEYVGMEMTHPASFRKYLKERVYDELPVAPKAFHFLSGEGDCKAECERLGKLISAAPIDAAFVGIGENGHLAFNDPPADFDTEVPYIVVKLDDACRQQQFGEGWFPTFDSVPTEAISMSIRQIMKSKHIICTVPDLRKAKAVAESVQGPVSNLVPASILQTHPQTHLFLDEPAASLLKR